MKTLVLGVIFLIFAATLFAQRTCASFDYQQQEIKKDPLLLKRIKDVEQFILHNQNIIPSTANARTTYGPVIRIPVIVHILYHYPAENISDDEVQSQIAALNRDYRKTNPDTVNIPSPFKPLAADCEIEFVLAKVDPKGRATNGIIHKYTPIKSWEMDDKIKFTSYMGDDGWDANSYLNIWVGNINRLLGYSSVPGSDLEKDGIVINFSGFGTINNLLPNNLGRTTVHEVGHWLGLRHTWGDAECGDDLIDDTPKQRGFTSGCPSTTRISCGNDPNGDMYMNYMDFTNDACLNMFTNGQKERMRDLFSQGGPRYSILFSKGLSTPAIAEIPPPENAPKWLKVKIYPNPSSLEITLDFEYDARWIGKEIIITNISGQIIIRKIITSKLQTINVRSLKPGIYFITADKDDEKVREKFVKID